MATTTNYSWETPDDTDLVKDGAAAIRTLGSSIDTTTKALNPSTTLGDIEYRSSTANTNTRLGIGSTGQVLTVAGGVPTWATASSGTFPILSTTAAGADFSTSSTSYVDATGMTITRTPVSGTNKIEVKASFSIYCGANIAIDFKMLAGGTASGLAYGRSAGVASYNIFNVLFYFTNVPASSTVFKLQVKTDGGSITLQGANAGFNNNFSVLEVY